MSDKENNYEYISMNKTNTITHIENMEQSNFCFP